MPNIIVFDISNFKKQQILQKHYGFVYGAGVRNWRNMEVSAYIAGAYDKDIVINGIHWTVDERLYRENGDGAMRLWQGHHKFYATYVSDNSFHLSQSPQASSSFLVFVKKNVNQRSDIHHREFFLGRHPGGGFHDNHPHHYLQPDSDRHYHASFAYTFFSASHR